MSPFYSEKTVCPAQTCSSPIKNWNKSFSENTCKWETLQPKCLNINDSQENKYVEDKRHFLLHCNQYLNHRQHLYSSMPTTNFEQFSENDKFIYLLTNHYVARLVGQFIVNAFDVRICN